MFSVRYTHKFKFIHNLFAKGFFQSSSFSWSLLEGRGRYLFFVQALRKMMMRLIGITFRQKT